jgi:hypothetical protein
MAVKLADLTTAKTTLPLQKQPQHERLNEEASPRVTEGFAAR